MITLSENSRHKTTIKMNWHYVELARWINKQFNYTQQQIADIFGISQQNMSKILNNKIWVNSSQKMED